MVFILHMYAEDHADEFKIIDPAIGKGETKSQVFAAWSDVLIGKTKDEFDRNPIVYLKKYYNWTNK